MNFSELPLLANIRTLDFRTLADRLAELGDIPPERIILAPHPGPATKDDVVALCNATDKRLCELIEGVLVEKAKGIPESALALILSHELLTFVMAHKLGFVFGADGPIRFLTERIRMPDISVILRERLPNGRLPNEQVLSFAPNLAVEVLSPGNTVKEMLQKREDYFAAGVTTVWEVTLPDQAIRVYSGVHEFVTLGIGDVLTGEPVLPGFQLPVKKLFAALNGQ